MFATCEVAMVVWSLILVRVSVANSSLTTFWHPFYDPCRSASWFLFSAHPRQPTPISRLCSTVRELLPPRPQQQRGPRMPRPGPHPPAPTRVPSTAASRRRLPPSLATVCPAAPRWPGPATAPRPARGRSPPAARPSTRPLAGGPPPPRRRCPRSCTPAPASPTVPCPRRCRCRRPACSSWRDCVASWCFEGLHALQAPGRHGKWRWRGCDPLLAQMRPC